MIIYILIVAHLSALVPSSSAQTKPLWAWECIDNINCVKKEYSSLKKPLSFHACHLVCANSVLWPYPTGEVNVSKEFISVYPQSVSLQSSVIKRFFGNYKVMKFLDMAGEHFIKGVKSQLPNNVLDRRWKKLFVNVFLNDSSVDQFTQETDESYNLEITTSGTNKFVAVIKANNYFGARHGLETLRQLIVYDSLSKSLIMPTYLKITDAPVFKYRGILIDTSRHFIEISEIKRAIEAMSANKLNTFHWHITDSHSFPFKSKTYPKFTQYGAYSDSEIYTEDDIRNIVRYGLIHGVRVLPELDGPSHVGEGWQWTPENTIVCFKQEPWQQYCIQPPCGQLNPTSDNVYDILKGLYSDMTKLFPSDLFHMGGDEVNLNCWNSSANVVENMAKMGLNRSYDDFHELWSIYQKRALAKLDSVTGKPKDVILWTSTLTNDTIDKYLDKNRYIIQVWSRANSTMISNLIKKGYRIIFSNYNALYFDCGFGNWAVNTNLCTPYITWQTVYENHPKSILLKQNLDWESNKHLVLGSEATLWTETMDDSSLSSRLWPRGAAMAETLWTASGGTWLEAKNRMNYNRGRMLRRGFMPDAIQPEWCDQNEGLCYFTLKKP